MGHGQYSYAAHQAITENRSGKSAQQVFSQREVHPLMKPKGVSFRESRDSTDHPESLGIIFALDVSGSMGAIPDLLARQELPGFMKTLTSCGVKSPQILFMPFTDHGTDAEPLQVGQFESTAELIDQWLTRSWLIGGGRTPKESYELPLYFAARHTKMDCWEKRKKKGYLFITGDEPAYPVLAKDVVKNILDSDIPADIPIEEVITAALETFEVFFLIPDAGRAVRVGPYWDGLFPNRVVRLTSPDQTCLAAAALVALHEGAITSKQDLEKRLTASGTSESRAQAVCAALEPWVDQA